MKTLPNDTRFWASAADVDNSNREQSVLISLIAAGETGDLRILGSAFVIVARDNYAICMGASHSFEEIAHRQRRQKGTSDLHMSEHFRIRKQKYVDTSEIKALYIPDGKPYICEISQLNYIDDFDIAVFVIQLDAKGVKFDTQLAVTLSSPNVGDQVIAISQNFLVEQKGDGEGTMQRSLAVLMGTVTEVVWDRSYLPGQSLFFRTTIPIKGGMSGSPVLLQPITGDKLTAVGVVSSDISDESSFVNFRIPGQSAVSMIWPAMSFGIHAPKDEHSAPSFTNLMSLLDSGIIDSDRKNVSLKIEYSPDDVAIEYGDIDKNISCTLNMLSNPYNNVK